MAEQLSVSRNTVLNAYEQLLAEGYLEAKAGSGTYVAQVLPEQLLAAPGERAAPCPAAGAASQPRFAARAQRVLAAPRFATEAPDDGGRPRPFRFGVPALDAFPHEVWSQLIVRHARRLRVKDLAYQSEAGYGPLREAIAAHVTVSRRVRCTPDQILVVSGSQGGLDLATRMLIDPGEAAWMEDPGCFEARGRCQG
jgi:GntR family transcriptional regulator/MocR family aminotransferase